jgi:bifunctional non-homologous end joining protein LigD
MSLKTYSEKRHFDKTPEPAPSEKPTSRKNDLQFCVQRHHATHLHYDFRLEVGGALKSWAVPKGPTLDPAIKRLAMMVEDHPLEYGSFEGVIPKGNYGAGSVMLWDHGTYELLGDASAEDQLTRGDFKFRLAGEKISGEFAIVRTKRGKGNEWLLIKKKDASAQPGWDPEDHATSVVSGRTQEEIARGLEGQSSTTRKGGGANKSGGVKSKGGGARNIPGTKAPMPKDLTPMLAQIGKGEPPTDPGWLFEVKWDGVRALCYIENGKLRMISRNGNVIDRQYPELSILPHHVNATTAVIDGEIAALDERGVPSFELLQRRINVAEASAIALLSRNHPVVFFAFDLLYLDGHDLHGVALVERKRLLQEILTPGDGINYSNHFEGNGAELLAAAKQQGLEGIVGKRANSFYESRRGSDWVKYKVTASSSFVLCGFTKGERDFFGALVLGVYDGGKLVWAGNVGTGFDHKMMKLIHSKLEPLATQKCPVEPDKNLPREVTWVRPELVCECKFSNWTEDGRLRAPVFMGLRPDIDPSECVREAVVAEAKASERIAHTSLKASSAPITEPRPEEAALSSPEAQAAETLPDRPNPTTLLAADEKEATRTIDGHSLKFTNLDKFYYPKDGYRKRDVLNYYDAVAPLLVPHLKDRPMSLKRYPNGIDKPYFFQKEAAEKFPSWVPLKKAPDGINYVVMDNRATLLFLTNLGCIDHNPWMSRVGSYEHPDYVLIDLDPFECPFEKVVEAALLVRAKLDKAELESYPKTTGGDGLHIYIPLEPIYTYEQVRSFAELLSMLVVHERPGLFTTPRAVSKREENRVYFDWQQIAQGKTISAPYVMRAYPGAPVATPLAWREVTPKLHPNQFHIGNALARFDRVGDLFKGVLDRPQELDQAIEKLR